MTDERKVYDRDHQHFRRFLKAELPIAQHDAVVFTRRCVYTDTLDGHFWDRSPSRSGGPKYRDWRKRAWLQNGPRFRSYDSSHSFGRRASLAAKIQMARISS